MTDQMTAEDGSVLERFTQFSFVLFEISRCWHKLASEEMAGYGLKGAHAVYLVALQSRPDGLTAAELAELCGRDKADVSRAMAQFELQGLIRREGVHHNLYRAQLRLTEDGQRIAAAVCGRAGVAVALAGRDLSASDREVLYTALTSIADNLKILSKEGLPEAVPSDSSTRPAQTPAEGRA